MKAWIIRWLTSGKEVAPPLVTSESHLGQRDHPTVRIGVMEAMNGKLLEVSTYKPNPRGPDWTTSYWIMDERPLTEQLATVLIMKGLDK